MTKFKLQKSKQKWCNKIFFYGKSFSYQKIRSTGLKNLKEKQQLKKHPSENQSFIKEDLM